MRPGSASPTNVVRFQPAASARTPVRDQRSFMDAVYAAGSLAVAAEDRTARTMASRLQIFGFVAIDEVRTDGSLRRLKASEAAAAAREARWGARPWRVSKTASAWGGADGDEAVRLGA